MGSGKSGEVWPIPWYVILSTSPPPSPPPRGQTHACENLPEATVVTRQLVDNVLLDSTNLRSSQLGMISIHYTIFLGHVIKVRVSAHWWIHDSPERRGANLYHLNLIFCRYCMKMKTYWTRGGGEGDSRPSRLPRSATAVLQHWLRFTNEVDYTSLNSLLLGSITEFANNRLLPHNFITEAETLFKSVTNWYNI